MAEPSPSRAPMKARPPATCGEMSAHSPAISAALEHSLFVIPSINGGSLLRRMLPTLRLPPHTVVVLDQGSLDDTEAVCRAAGVRLVQLGRPHTYTEAGNIGARMAREAGCDFIFLSNNDIAFTTDVGAELLAEMLDDPLLGIVAPSQVIVDEKAGRRHLAYRVEWHLDAMRFIHDFRTPGADVGRLEADLCELTCAAVRMTAIDEIGFLDDDFGFYHEDADFCFRLRRAGYSCAYLPRSQIEHYTTSTFSAGLSDRKRAYMARNTEHFARKHLGYGVGRMVSGSRVTEAQGGVDRHLPGYLGRFGLIESGRPALVRGELGAKPLDYLHVDIPPPALSTTLGRLRAYRGIVAGSERARRALRDAGFEAVGCAPLGIETDLFHPWVPATRLFEETTFLVYRPEPASLAAALRAWAMFQADNRNARLIVVGVSVLGAVGQAPARFRQWGQAVIADHHEDGVQLHEISAPFSDEQLATLFRGVDAVVFTRQDAVPDLAAAFACGTLALFPDEGPTSGMGFVGAMTLSGRMASEGVWAPDVESLSSRFHEVHDLGPARRRALALGGLSFVRARLTWRSTCTGLSETLTAWQEPADVISRLRELRQAEETALAADPDEMLFGARETDEHHFEDESAIRPARQPVPTPQLEPTDAQPKRRWRLARRLRDVGRGTYGTWRIDGKRAAVRLIARSLALRVETRLRWLTGRLGRGTRQT